MPEEIEAKVRIEDAEAFRRRMPGLAGSAGETVFEVNRLFDDAEGSLRGRGSALRVREAFTLPGRRPLRTILTFKGPLVPGPVKRRPELEVDVEAAEPLVAILEAMGLSEAFRYEKRRTTWHAGGCEVVLDELPHLGWFVEVEGTDPDVILAQLARLGLDGRPVITRSYVHLLAERLSHLGIGAAAAVFDE